MSMPWGDDDVDEKGAEQSMPEDTFAFSDWPSADQFLNPSYVDDNMSEPKTPFSSFSDQNLFGEDESNDGIFNNSSSSSSSFSTGDNFEASLPSFDLQFGGELMETELFGVPPFSETDNAPVVQLKDLVELVGPSAQLLASIMSQSKEIAGVEGSQTNSQNPQAVKQLVTLGDISALSQISTGIRDALMATQVWRIILRSVVFGMGTFSVHLARESPALDAMLLEWERVVIAAWSPFLIKFTSHPDVKTADDITYSRLVKRLVEHIIMTRRHLVSPNGRGLQFGTPLGNQERGAVLRLFPVLLELASTKPYLALVNAQFNDVRTIVPLRKYRDVTNPNEALTTARHLYHWARESHMFANPVHEYDNMWCQLIAPHDSSDAHVYVMTSSLFDTVSNSTEQPWSLPRVLAFDRSWHQLENDSKLERPALMSLNQERFINLQPLFGDRMVAVNSFTHGPLLIGVYGVCSNIYQQQFERRVSKSPNGNKAYKSAAMPQQVALGIYVWNKRTGAVVRRDIISDYAIVQSVDALYSSTPMVLAEHRLLSIHASRRLLVLNFVNTIFTLEWDAESSVGTVITGRLLRESWATMLGANITPDLDRKVPTFLRERFVKDGGSVRTNTITPETTLGNLWSGNVATPVPLLRCASMALDQVHGRRFLAYVVGCTGIIGNSLSKPRISALVWVELNDANVWTVRCSLNAYRLFPSLTPHETSELIRLNQIHANNSELSKYHAWRILERRDQDMRRMSATHEHGLGSIMTPSAAHLTFTLITPAFYDANNNMTEKDKGSANAHIVTLVSYTWQRLSEIMNGTLERLPLKPAPVNIRVIVTQLERVWVTHIAGLPYLLVKRQRILAKNLPSMRKPASVTSRETIFLVEPGTISSLGVDNFNTQMSPLRERIGLDQTLVASHVLGVGAGGMLLIAVHQVNDPSRIMVIPLSPDRELLQRSHPDARLLSSSALWNIFYRDGGGPHARQSPMNTGF